MHCIGSQNQLIIVITILCPISDSEFVMPMRYRRLLTGLILAVLAVSSTWAGCYGDIPPAEVPEHSLISSSSSVNLVGSILVQDSLLWRQSSEMLGENVESTPDGLVYSAEPPLNPAREIQMVSGYGETTQGVSGTVSYTKTTSIRTEHQAADQDNLDTNRILTFNSTGVTGRIVTTEDILLDTAGNSQTTSLSAICPFITSLVNECTPPFCNVIKVASTSDMTRVSIASESHSRSISAEGDPAIWPPISIADVPVRLGYSTTVKYEDYGLPAQGSTVVTLDSHLQDGAQCTGPIVKGEEITYNTRYSAEGDIALFQQSIGYESGIRRVTGSCATCQA